MALAKRMVAYREAHGPFGGLPALDGVPGVGPGLLGALAEHLSFSGAPRRAAGAPAYREGQPGPGDPLPTGPAFCHDYGPPARPLPGRARPDG